MLCHTDFYAAAVVKAVKLSSYIFFVRLTAELCFFSPSPPSALGQIMLYVDGMNGVIRHAETIQWLYTLVGSKVEKKKNTLWTELAVIVQEALFLDFIPRTINT